MRLRLHGTPAEVNQTLTRLVEVFTVAAVSPAYPDQPPSRLVRVYLDIRP